MVSCTYTNMLTESMVPKLILTNHQFGNDILRFASTGSLSSN